MLISVISVSFSSLELYQNIFLIKLKCPETASFLLDIISKLFKIVDTVTHKVILDHFMSYEEAWTA